MLTDMAAEGEAGRQGSRMRYIRVKYARYPSVTVAVLLFTFLGGRADTGTLPRKELF